MTSVVAANVLGLTVRQLVFGGNSLPNLSTTQINRPLLVKDVAPPPPLLADGTSCVCRLQWALGQPDRAFGGEDCGDLRTMSKFIGLNDYNCNTRQQWICEKPKRLPR